MQRVTDVVQNTLESGEMRLPWFVHMKADLLSCIGDIGSGEGDILKSTQEATKVCRIRHWCVVGRELRIHINRRRAGLVVSRASTIKDLNHIPTLGEKETRACVLCIHGKKMKSAYILHGELLLKGNNDLLE